jgi:hypothetical protein
MLFKASKTGSLNLKRAGRAEGRRLINLPKAFLFRFLGTKNESPSGRRKDSDGYKGY